MESFKDISIMHSFWFDFWTVFFDRNHIKIIRDAKAVNEGIIENQKFPAPSILFYQKASVLYSFLYCPPGIHVLSL